MSATAPFSVHENELADPWTTDKLAYDSANDDVVFNLSHPIDYMVYIRATNLYLTIINVTACDDTGQTLTALTTPYTALNLDKDGSIHTI